MPSTRSTLHWVQDDGINIRSIREQDPPDHRRVHGNGNGTKDSPRTKTSGKKKLAEKAGSKLACAIKALQCSPRVDREGGDKYTGGPLSEDRQSLRGGEERRSTRDRYLLHKQERSPDFVADFANFESMEYDQEQQQQAPALVSVSTTLELEKVLANLDNSSIQHSNTHGFADAEGATPHTQTQPRSVDSDDELEIYADSTCTLDTANDINENENENDNDNDNHENQNDVDYDCDSDSEHHQRGAIEASASSRSPPGSPSQLHKTIENEFGRYSTDSNDTPVTCNKSLVVLPTPPSPHGNGGDGEFLGNSNGSLSGSGTAHAGDPNGLFGKPPKTILHRSLSLGDALSPTEDDDGSPIRWHRPSGGVEEHKDDVANHPGRPSARQQQIELLQLPVMEEGPRQGLPAGFVGESGPGGQGSGLHTNAPAHHGLAATRIRDENDDVSALTSSTVSSFVFSRVSQQSETTWSLLRQQHRPAGRDAPEAVRRGFFWKTRPCVTVKSYRFQQPRPRHQPTQLVQVGAATAAAAASSLRGRQPPLSPSTPALHPDVLRKMTVGSQPFPVAATNRVVNQA
ncbi:unnamed protein product [Pseudo-nitzschia multistriata]|uniref:Uncharacterized protein n=1 Tax=Pseudo-nitzschia multistriata TaxID=183589 RepID=A0A448ZRP9_9STRA|nr:unnamed protein product [Pseudo-nitzschia multistriata]